MKIRALKEYAPPAVVVAIGAWAMIAFSVAQWRTMQVPSWDLAIFSELAKAYSRFEAPIVPVKGDGYNLLGDHFHPILVLLGPIWRLFPTPLSLLIVQDLLLAASAWPLTRLACRLTNAWVGGALGLLYVLSWGLQGAVAAQFHEIAFAVPMLAFASAAFVERRWRAVAAWSAPLVLVKEDLGLTVMLIGLVIVLVARGQPRTRARGLSLAAFGLAAFIVTIMILLPALNPNGEWAYGLGSQDGQAMTVVDLLTRPFIPPIKVQTTLILVATAGLVGLRSPWIVLAAPTLAWRFLGSVDFYWEWSNWHYNAVLMPIAVGALLDVVARAHCRGRWATADEPALEPQGNADPAPAMSPPRQGWLTVPLPLRRMVAAGLAVTFATGALTAPHLPLWAMTQKGFGVAQSRVDSAHRVMDAIPEGATVESDLSLLAYLVPKAEVSWVGTSESDKEYVVIDRQAPSWGGGAPRDAATWAEEQSPTGASYTLILSLDGYQVARRDG